MKKVFISPSRYVQGKNVLMNCADEIRKLGEKPMLLCDDTVWGIVGEAFFNYLKKEGFNINRIAFNGEASDSEIARLNEIGAKEQNDSILALGGGKTIDSAKAVGDDLNIPVGILPTIASTDAPTSALSVIYSEDGVFERYRLYNKNPNLVLVDTQVISRAPVRLLAAGIGDASATFVEARSSIAADAKAMAGGSATLAGLAIAQKCEETLFAYSVQAIEANRAKVVTPALDLIIEANTLLSGIGFESGGLGASHAIHNGFTALHGPIHEKMHGEKVAYGVLTHLFLENRPLEEIDRYIDLYQRVGLPTTLADLNLGDVSREDLFKVGEQSTVEGETMHDMPIAVSAGDVADALVAVDAYVRSRKECCKH